MSALLCNSQHCSEFMFIYIHIWFSGAATSHLQLFWGTLSSLSPHVTPPRVLGDELECDSKDPCEETNNGPCQLTQVTKTPPWIQASKRGWAPGARPLVQHGSTLLWDIHPEEL